MPYINVYEVTHFTDRFSGTSWSLYPLTPQIKETWFNIILYLQIGPHQTQILGLYIFLLLLSPLFWECCKRVTSTPYWAPRC
ncbi:Uncharacterised protein [Klebsiella quasipneumoniae]|nr:Uncharacterised protein [Klebsiella quasipneumoniae]